MNLHVLQIPCGLPECPFSPPYCDGRSDKDGRSCSVHASIGVARTMVCARASEGKRLTVGSGIGGGCDALSSAWLEWWQCIKIFAKSGLRRGISDIAKNSKVYFCREVFRLNAAINGARRVSNAMGFGPQEIELLPTRTRRNSTATQREPERFLPTITMRRSCGIPQKIAQHLRQPVAIQVRDITQAGRVRREIGHTASSRIL